MRENIPRGLRLSTILVAVGPLLLASVAISWLSLVRQEARAIQLQTEVAERVSTVVEDGIRDLEDQLYVMIQAGRFWEVDREQQEASMLQVLAHQEMLDDLLLLDGQAREQVRVSLMGTTVSSIGWQFNVPEFSVPRSSRETYYGPVLYYNEPREPSLNIALPIADPRSDVVDAVLVAEVQLKEIWDEVLTDGWPGVDVYIVDVEDEVAGVRGARNPIVAHPNPDIVLSRFDPPSTSGIHSGREGNPVMLVSDEIRLGDQVLIVVVESPITEAFALTIGMARILLIMLGISLLAALIVTAIANRKVVQPIRLLVEASEAVTAGDLDHEVSLKTKDEMGKLAAAFNGMTAQLRGLMEKLEQRVAQRTADLEHRTVQLEAVARVAREVASIRNEEQLLEQTVELVSEHFGYYHVAVYLLDEAKDYAVLRAASSEGGRRMLAHTRQLRVGQEGVVGYVTGWGEPRVVLDTGSDAVFFDNPELPDTRSEMALPLQYRGEIIGALDIQSREPEAFSHEDVTVLQSLADQVAVAIGNAWLFRQVEVSMEAERRAYGELSRKAWVELLRSRPELGKRYDPHRILTTNGSWRDDMKRAAREGRPVVSEDDPAALSLPIKVRDQVVGIVDAHKPEDSGGWTSEEVELMGALTDQLGMALEGARLYQETQLRATREQLTGEITAHMRETLDMETVLKTAVRELRQALGLPEVVIRLGVQAREEHSDLLW